MKNIYLLVLLFIISTTSLTAQEKLIDLPFAVDNYDLLTHSRLNNHHPFTHRPSPNKNYFWAYDDLTQNLVEYIDSDQVGLEMTSSENGIYWATKPKDQEYEIAVIELYRHTGISGQEAEVIFSRSGYYLSFIGTNEHQLYFEVDNYVFILDELNGNIQSAGYAQSLRSDGLFWKNSYYWSFGSQLRKVDTNGITLVANSDFTIKDISPLNDWLIWQDSIELYRYDGINEAKPYYRFSSEVGFRNVNLAVGATIDGNTFYFSAPHPTAGQELWQTDGTTAGTFLFKDLTPGTNNLGQPNSSYASSFHEHEGRLHFLAYDVNFHTFHWVSDGSENGTQQLEDLTDFYEWKNLLHSSKLTTGGYLLGVSSTKYGAESVIFRGGVVWQDIFIGSGNGRPESFYLPRSYELSDGTVMINAVTEENGQEPWLLPYDQAPLPLGDFTPGVSWSDSYLLTESEDDLLLIAGNLDQGHSIYRASRTVPASLPAPAPTVDWVQTLRNAARNAASLDFLYGIDLVKATDGSLYSSGSIPRNSCSLMHAPYSPAEKLGEGCYPNFVVKYSEEGLPLWQMGLPGFAYTSDVPILAAGPDAGVYLSSRSNADGFIGDYPFNPSGVDAYVTRLSATGEVLWVREFSLDGGKIFQMRSDQEGNAYLCGTFENQLSIQGKSVSANIRPSYFVAKFTPAGEVAWLQVIPPNLEWPSWAPVVAFKMDAQNNAYLVLNNAAHNYSVSCNYGNFYAGLIKLNPEGEIILRQEWESNDAWYTTDLDFTTRGNIILVGQFRGQLKLGAYELVTQQDCEYEGFVAKITPFGEVIQVNVLPDNRIPEAVIAQDDDTYVLAGHRALPQYTSYPGYTHYPFGPKKDEVFVSIYDAYNELITERTFLAWDEFSEGGYLGLVATEDNQYILQTENQGVLDTLAGTNSNALYEANVVITAFTLNYEVPPTIEDGELSANDLHLFPNPATDFVNIQTTDADFSIESVRLFNALGQEIIPDLALLETGYYRLKTDRLPPGKYWLMHGDNQEPVTLSFVKVRK